MAKILLIETATKNCSVALAENDCIIDVMEIAGEGFQHAEKLHVFIQQLLKKNNLKPTQLDAVCVSKGPGSYTGLRLGVSAAKGLCYTLQIPLLAINTLDVLARQLNIGSGLIVPMIDARRMEVYCKIFDAQFNTIQDTKAIILDEFSLAEFSEYLYFIGDGAEKAKTIFSKSNHHFPENIIYPSAKDLAPMGYLHFSENKFEDIAYFEPFYLKDFLINLPKNK